jgi:pseudouridine synthase
MRINQFVATASGLSRRAADRVIAAGEVSINGQPSQVGQTVDESDIVTLNGQTISLPLQSTTVVMNKPIGYVCSRNGQGSSTIYDLLPKELHSLKTVGRLDKDSSGLLLLTDDGKLANRLTHPSFAKQKIYHITINRPLEQQDLRNIEQGIKLEDGISALKLRRLVDDKSWEVTMHEGRTRQIRRTFAKLGYNINRLERLVFGDYRLDNLAVGSFRKV